MPAEDAPDGGRRRRLDARESLARFSSFSVPGHRGELEPFLKRLAVLIAVILAVQVAGTIGFMLTEDVSAWRGFVWTVDTIATIGSIPDPDSTGGQIVKVGLIMLGTGGVLMVLGILWMRKIVDIDV